MNQTTLNQNWNHYRVGRINGLVSYQVNDWTASTTTSYIPTINLSAFLMSYTNGNQELVDWLFVRKWCGSEPSVALGEVEIFETSACGNQ